MDNAFFSLVPGAEEYPPLQQEIAALFGSDAYTQLSHYTDFVSRFNAIIAAPNSVSPGMRNYLINCNLRDPTNGPIDYRHRDEWITRLAYESMTLTGRTFGVADPENITEADPLGLMFQTDGVTLRDDVLILDYDAVSTDAADQYGPVIVKSPNTCVLPDGTTAKTAGGSALFFTGGTGVGYRYQFLGGDGDAADGLNCWSSLNEFGGGGGRTRFLDSAAAASKTMTVYVRYSANHVIRNSIYLGKRSGQFDPVRIIIRGYPTDAMPVIRCGTATPGDNTVTSLPTFRMGQDGAAQARKNMWFRWLDFVGNRDHAGYDGGAAGLCFAQTLFYVGAPSSGLSIRNCILRDFQPIDPNHEDAGDFPQYVDVAQEDRSSTYTFEAVRCYGDGLDFQYNYVKAAGTDIPYTYPDAGSSGVYGRGVTMEGSNGTVAYCTFDGFCPGDYIHFTPGSGSSDHITGMWIHHNVVTSNGYTCLLAVSGSVASESLSGVIEQNFIYNWGTEDIQPQGGTGVSLFGQGITFRNNVVACNIDGQQYRTGLTTQGFRIDTMDATGAANAVANVDAYGNIFWKAGVVIGNNNGFNFPAAGTSISRLYQNIVHDLAQPNKIIPDGEVSDGRRDGVIVLQTSSSVGLGSNTLDANNITRPVGETNSAVLLAHRVAGTGATQYGESGLSGYTNTTTLDPEFSDPDNGDFTVGNVTLAAMVAATPKTRAAVGAWTPPS